MKKRIISLILVVALMFLTLTGCAFNYAKEDMSKYATLDSKFREAIKSLVIEDATFGVDDATRWVKVEDAIAKALLEKADADGKQFAGKPNKYDQFSFCYYAVCEDKDGNKTVILTKNMKESGATSIQLGSSALTDLNEKVSAAILGFEGDSLVYYTTSGANIAGKGDIVAVSYTKTEKGENKTPVVVEYESITVGGEEGSFAQWLVGKQIGVKLDDPEAEFVEVTKKATNEGETDETKTYVYSDVKINLELKNGSSAQKVEANDLVFVTYTATIEYTPEADGDEKVSASIAGYKYTNGKYVKTVKDNPELLQLGAADSTAEGATKTFLGQLVGKIAGTTTSEIKIEEEVEVTTTIGDKKEVTTEKVTVTYSTVNVNWIVNSDMKDAIEITDYKPASATDVYGNTVTIGEDSKVTYYVYPVSYLPVDDVDVEVDKDGKVSCNVSAETIIREFYADVAKTAIEEHDESVEHDHNHEDLTYYVFSTLEGGKFKTGEGDKEKTLATLVEELVKLYSTHTTNESDLTKKLSTNSDSLEKALGKLAKDTSKDDSSTKESLKTAVANARKAYEEAKTKADKSQEAVDKKIAEILSCVDGETKLDAPLAADYANYHYDTLETTYKSEIKMKLAEAIYDLLTDDKLNYVTYKELPARAVKDAYKAKINTYKYTFYEEKVSTDKDAETYYEKYNGDFDSYFVVAVQEEAKANGDKMTETPSVAKAEEYVMAQAEETVKEIIVIYLLANEFDQALTKEEIKSYKNTYKTLEIQYKNLAYLGITLPYSYEDYLNIKQFDKVFDYLLEEDKENEENKVKYPNLGGDYTFKSDEKDETEDK